MQTLIQKEPASLELLERLYDIEDITKNRGVDDANVFSELALGIRQQSVILAMGEATTKEKIYNAYTHDLDLLTRYHREFEGCMQAAVRYSIIPVTGGMRKQREKYEETWQLLKSQIPSAGVPLFIDFPYTRASLEVSQLLVEMKEEFGKGIVQILKLLAEWLRFLVQNELIGLVEWGDLDVCRYHYFKHEIIKEVLEERRRRENSFDGTQPYGSRNQVKLIADQTIVRRQFRERHVHHIIRAKLHRLEEYPYKTPQHVAAFIDAIPASLQPYMHIVEGTITMEEVFRRQVGEEQFVKSEVLSVDKYSPGVLFGHFNLIGWSGDDLQAGSVFYSLQRAAQKHKRQRKAAETRGRLLGHLFTS